LVVLVLSVSTFVLMGKSTAQEVLNGWGFVCYAAQMMFSDIGIILIVIFAALLLAEETGSGTIRFVLPSPLSRIDFFCAKVLMALIYVVGVSLFTLLLAVAIGALRYPFGGVSDYAGLVYSRGQVLMHLAIALLLSWVPLIAAASYGILMSALITQPAKAMGAAIGLLFTVDMTKHIFGFEPYVFTRYVVLPWAIFQQIAQGIDSEWYPAIRSMVVVSLATVVVCLGVAMVVFVRRDLN
jgi:ABC-2 type transport system permease protein